MGGLVLDIVVEYIVRVVMRIANLVRSHSWPTVTAKVRSSFYVKAGYGCDIVEIDYKYCVDGQSYTGNHKKAWIGFHGEDYVARFPRGAELVIRIKPGEPSISIMEKTGSLRTETANVQPD